MTGAQAPSFITCRQWLALVAIILIATCVRCYALGRAPLWLDEQCQLAAAQTPTLGACWRRGGELGPIGQLSFVESWIAWHAGGHTRAWFRLPSVLWGIAAVAMCFVLGRRWFSTTTGLYLAALVAVSGIHIQFSREARGYSLLVLLSVVWAWLLDRFASRPEWASGIVLLLIAEASLYVHPAFLIVMVALGAAMIVSVWVDTRQSVTSVAIVAIVAAASVLYWIVPRPLPLSTANKPESNSLMYLWMDIYKQLLGGYWGISSYLIFAFALIGTFAGLRGERTRGGTICALSVSVAGTAPILVGHFQGAAVFARYSLFALPFLLMLPAHGIEASLRRLPDQTYIKSLSSVVLALLLMLGMYSQNRSPYDLEKFKISRPDWPTLDR